MTPQARIIAETTATMGRLLPVVAAATPGLLAEPSVLPGWSRSHVLAHIVGVGHGLARQAEYAHHGDTIEMYDGGQEGRDAAIEARVAGSVADHHQALLDTAARLATAWSATSDWDAPVRYRFGSVDGVLHAWWRELCIHAVDVDLGLTADDWSEDLCSHLFHFLARRLPEPARLVATDHPIELAHDVPGPTAPTIEGSARDLAVWLAGRTPTTAPRATIKGRAVAAPTLGPWPPPSDRTDR